MSIADQAFALLDGHRSGKFALTRKAGSFLGQCVTDPQPLTEKQADWLATLLERAGISEGATP
jgi:hypothetical protein